MAMFDFFRARAAEPVPTFGQVDTPDLGTQLEDLLVTVWEEERGWRVEDRLEMILRLERSRDA